MSPENNPEQTPETSAVTVQPDSTDIQVSSSGNEGEGEQYDAVKAQVLSVLSDLFNIVGKFFSEYKKPLINIGLVVGALVAVYLVISVVDAIHDVPLLSPLFELVGIGYTGWFVFRFMLTAESRQELYSKISNFTSKVTGSNS